MRLDGRKFDQIRPLNIEVGFLPAAHGSALFTRGETQAMVTATLGTLDDIQIIDGLEEEYKKKFYLHYNFPGYSVGECKPNRGPGRREMGHGMLAERSIMAVLPDAWMLVQRAATGGSSQSQRTEPERERSMA